MNSQTMLPFAEDASEVFRLAHEEAHRFCHEYVGSEHILLGIAKQVSGLGRFLLGTFDLDLRKVRVGVESLIGAGAIEMGAAAPISNKLPQSPRVEKIKFYASEEARKLNHDTIESLHLLLGIRREEECVAAQVLMNLGVDFDVFYERTLLYLENTTSISREDIPNLSFWLMRLKVALGQTDMLMSNQDAMHRAVLFIEGVQEARKKYTLY